MSPVQDRYAGDVGDFLKLGLLRWLVAPSFESPPVRLGIVWYRVADESHNADGKHVKYLDPNSKSGAALRPLDPRLYDGLAAVVESGHRSVEALEEAGVLPIDVRTFGDELTFAGLPAGPDRAAFRADWLARAQEELAACAVVFVDPDNGLRRSDHKNPSSHPKAIKHAYLDELAPFIERGQSVVAYQHADRSDKVRKQARRLMDDAAEELGVEPLAVVRADRGSTRLFLVVPVEAHRSHLERRLTALTGSPWAAELDVIWAGACWRTRRCVRTGRPAVNDGRRTNASSTPASRR